MSAPHETQDPVIALVYQVRRLYDALQDFDLAAARKLGVHRTDLQCLLMLEHGPVRVGILSSEVGLTSGATTALLDRLEKRKLVRRRAAKNDRRAVEVDLTARGRKQIGAIYRSAFETFAARLSGHEDLPAAAQVLSTLVDGCREAEKRLGAQRGKSSSQE